MARLYERMANSAEALIAEYSQDKVTLRKVESTYDPATGTKSETTTDYVVDAVGGDYSALERSGGLVEAADFELTVAAAPLSAAGVAPEQNWRLIVGSETFEVRQVTKVPPLGDIIIYKLRVGR